VLDRLRHSYVDLDDPTHLEFRYANVVADVVEASVPRIDDVLYIGGGGFTLPRYFRETAGAAGTVLELDPAVVAIAEEDLGLTPGPWLTLKVGDARVGLREASEDGFDAVVGDAFGGRAVPWHLTTREFVTEIRDRLRGDGVYTLNMIDYPPGRFVRAETATLASVFEHVAVIAPQALLDGSAGGNYVLVASDTPIAAPAIREAIAAREGTERLIVENAVLEFIDGARPLRDEFAPVDQLLSGP
jgi:spermidine synthase